ncbi:phosphatase PAP2 family protein [Streptomyces sp. NPDC088785]|uniref:phosphatase PAP2 family protein n=1 Tax=Streptomyces sp. NPDC088785 TaxID=3365897 RepID=UPI00380F5454
MTARAPGERGAAGARRTRQPPWLPRAGGVAVLLLALLTGAVLVAGDRPLAADTAVHAWSLGHRTAFAVDIARLVTATGTSLWPYLITFTAAALTGGAWTARLTRGLTGLGVLLAGQGVRLAVMALVARPRPPRAGWATHASGFSLPSGHTTTSAITAGVVCWAAGHLTHRGAGRCLRALAAAWAAAVACTRVYLGVHWASDIVAGWLLAVAWLALAAAALDAADRNRRAPTPPPRRNP